MFNAGRAAKSDYPRKSSFQYIFLPWIMYQSTFHISLPRICGCAVFAVFTAESRMLKLELEVGINSQSQKWCRRLWSEALSSLGALSRGIFSLEMLLLSCWSQFVLAPRQGRDVRSPSRCSLPGRSLSFPRLTEGMCCSDLSAALREATSSLPNLQDSHSSLSPQTMPGVWGRRQHQERTRSRVSSTGDGRDSCGTQDFSCGSHKELCHGHDTVMSVHF